MSDAITAMIARARDSDEIVALLGAAFQAIESSSADVVPRTTLQQISGVPAMCLTGPTTLDTVRVQANHWGATVRQARQVAQAWRDHFHGYRGVIGETQVDSCWIEDERDTPGEPSPGLTNQAQRCVQQDYLLMLHEPLPAGVPALTDPEE